MTKQRFYCPAEGCDATYNVAFRTYQPAVPPRCKNWQKAFPAVAEDHRIHYRMCGPTVISATGTER